MRWTPLTEVQQIGTWISRSYKTPIAFFKHSTRCSISAMAKNRLESKWAMDEEKVIPVYIDVLSNRSVSEQLAKQLDVIHQSPQIILVKDGAVAFHTSHGNIDVASIEQLLE